jgi:hypothetical protein
VSANSRCRLVVVVAVAPDRLSALQQSAGPEVLHGSFGVSPEGLERHVDQFVQGGGDIVE